MSTGAFRIRTSSSLDALMGALADEVRRGPLPPLEDEVIVVQSQGMRRWVTLKLADALGCAASLRMPFPGSFSHRLAGQLAGTGGDPVEYEESLFGRAVMTWRLLGSIAEVAKGGRFPMLAAYLRDGDARKRYQLCARIANLFDDYQVYRPDVLLRWEAGQLQAPPARHEEWQAELWRRLCRDAPEPHLARRFETLIAELGARRAAPAGLPRRLAVFGVNTLPPEFLRLLVALARFIPVTLYLVTPGDPAAEESAQNPLMASMGQQGMEFLSLIRSAGGPEARWEAAPAERPPADSLLHRVQLDVLSGRGAEAPAARAPVAAEDDSLRVHVCHSPQREMEALRDQLLAAFAADATLRPQDVLVMLTDVAAYAPYIRSVFGVRQEGMPALPYHIADQPLGREEPMAESFLQLLRLADSRWTCTEVLELLERAAVRRAAGLSESDLPAVHTWVRKTNIRWGVDGRQRQECFDLPEGEANTWRAGLDRLLMGYGVGEREELVAGVLPYGDATSGRSAALGRLADWLDRLSARLRDLRRPRPLADWSKALAGVAEDFLLPADEADQETLLFLTRAFAGLATLQERSGFTGAVELPVLLEHLGELLADDGFGHGFISGGITFCAMKPMRTIPFAVIAIGGLNHDAFPRRDRTPAFDLQRQRRVGDRSLRGDDRQLFLESLLAARRRLILSYVGRSQKDNSVRAPSVCLSELLDYLGDRFAAAGGGDLIDQVTVVHRLQPFSPAYYDGSDARLFSFSRENCAAAQVPRETERTAAPFIAAPLELPEEPLRLELHDLVSFWINPSRRFCRQTLDLRLHDEEEAFEEVEPLAVDGLCRYNTSDWMVRRRLAGPADLEAEHEILSARCDLPPERLCSACHRQLVTNVEEFLESLGRPAFRDPVLMPPIAGKGWVLMGQLEGLTPDGCCQYRCTDRKPKDLIRAWVNHVALNAVRGAADPCQTRLVYRNGVWRLAPVDNPMRRLEALVEGYRRGLRAPLLFFEQSSHAFAERERAFRMKQPVKTPASVEALKKWAGPRLEEQGEPGDYADPYVALCFRGRDPLREQEKAFQEEARSFWEPLFEHLKEER